MSVLLLDVGASAPALPDAVPVAQVFGRWAPAVYQFPAVPVPGSFAATALADAVLLSWSAVSRATYVIERAPDVAGVAGAWSEIERTSGLAVGFPVAAGTAYWWRVRAVVFGRSSERTAAIKRAPNDMNASLANLATNLATVSGVASAAQASAAASLAALADIANDDLLTPDEKPAVLRDYSVITAEQAGIDSEADDYRIVSEKATYDAAVDALTAYLATLDTPVDWDDLGGNTAVDGAEFRGMFAAVYTARQALLNAITSVIKSRVDAAQGPNLAINYDFYTGIGLWTQAGGSTAGMVASPTDGYMRCTVPAGWAGGNFDVYEDHWIDVAPGDVLVVSGLLSAYGSTHSTAAGLHFVNADATSQTWVAAGVNAAGVASTPYTGTITVPAGMSRAQLWASVQGAVAGDLVTIKHMYCERSLLFKPGSGAQLGDARNLPMVTVGNYGAAWLGLSVTWTTTTTSATFTASAATLQMGTIGLPYNSASVTVSGSPGSTVTYYLYYDDPNYAGGSRALNATTVFDNSINYNGRLYIGEAKVTYPTSGTSGGGGPKPNCVRQNMLVIERTRGVIRAGDVCDGDWLRRGDGSWGRVAFSARRYAGGVRLRAADGAWLDCSTSAPIQTGMEFRLALEMPGHATPRWRSCAGAVVAVDDVLVTRATTLGEIAVQLITLDPAGDPRELARVFLASADGIHWWGHHNAKVTDPFDF